MASSIVIFGASGDLTSRKLIPALYRLSQRRRIDPDTRIVGVSRTPLDDSAWRKQLAESTAKYGSSAVQATATSITHAAPPMAPSQVFPGLMPGAKRRENHRPPQRLPKK